MCVYLCECACVVCVGVHVYACVYVHICVCMNVCVMCVRLKFNYVQPIYFKCKT